MLANSTDDATVAEVLMRMSRRLGILLSATCILPAAGCESASKEPSLEEVRSIAEKYRDLNVAKAEGYTTDNKCVTAAMLGQPAELGAMGLHYVRRDLLGLAPKPA
ncbi:MAG TPA: hypothetical protein VIJ81_01000, partial [Sphingomicrobium sp.]